MARVTSGHFVFDQASDRFTVKTGYSPVDGTKPSVKDRFHMGRSGSPDPKLPAPLGKADVQRGSERPARHFAQVRSTASLEGQVNEPPVIYFLGDC